MNPSVPEHVVAEAIEADPERASAEYLATFRTDVESFLTREALDAVVVPGRRELPPVYERGIEYVAFCDPSGGASDSMTLAIAHNEGSGNAERAVLDLVREVRPPFKPSSVVGEFVAVLRRYRIPVVRGDRYAAEWCAERFRDARMIYRASERSKSEIYRELLPVIHSGRVELLDHAKLVAQLLGLERRTARGGRDSIDHAPSAHDDLANSAAGALIEAARPPSDHTGCQF